MDLFDTYQDATDYLSDMAMDSTYGDELCVHSLALLYSVHVQIFTDDHGIQELYTELSPTVKLAYNGFDHYDAILSRQVSYNLPAPMFSSQTGNVAVSQEKSHLHQGNF